VYFNQMRGLRGKSVSFLDEIDEEYDKLFFFKCSFSVLLKATKNEIMKT
jgi:hypothetical protein